MKLHIVVSVLLISLVGSSLAQMAQGLRKLDLEGTWSSGSGSVLTGQGSGESDTFFNPMRRKFTVPKTSGYSYSFTRDGFFEMAQFTYNSSGRQPECFTASLKWQHGTYTLEGSNIHMKPYEGDGAIQVMGKCEDPQVKMDYYSENEIGANITVYTDTDIVFYSELDSMKVLQMHAFDGRPLPKMYLLYRPPRMMPTRSIFKKVIGAPGT